VQSISTIDLDTSSRSFKCMAYMRSPSGPTSAGEAQARLRILSETAAMSGGYRRVRLIAALVREVQALGHTVRFTPPAYVKPYLKRQKNDTRTVKRFAKRSQGRNFRFMPIETVEQQSCLMLHRARHLFIRQQMSPARPPLRPVASLLLIRLALAQVSNAFNTLLPSTNRFLVNKQDRLNSKT
jgi:transposase